MRPIYQKTRLDNGLSIVTEKHSRHRAVCCGVWVNRGTRHEPLHLSGAAHFIEHMVFKKTKNRSAFAIARDMEAVGGELNAFTSRENTCFVTLSLKENLELSMDVLSDLVCRAEFTPSDFRKEKKVVIQEIHMSEEQLEEYIFDHFFELSYAGSDLAMPILGTEKSLNLMNIQEIRNYYSQVYTPENMIVSVAGNLQHDQVVESVEKYFDLIKKTKKKPSKKIAKRSKRAPPQLKNLRTAIEKPAEQTHVLMGFPTASFRDPLRFESYIVNTCLGGGMTSKLYQAIREDRGLAYTVYSQLSTFTDCGVNLIYSACEPKKTVEVIDLTLKEIKKLKKQGLSKDDLELYRQQVRGQILLGSDDLENRMNSLGINEMIFGRYRSPDDVMREVQSVTRDSIQEYIEKYMSSDDFSLLIMGAMAKKSKQNVKVY